MNILLIINMMQKKSFLDILKDMASLRQQRNLCKSFEKYVYNPEWIKTYVNSIKETSDLELKKILIDEYSQKLDEYRKNSNTKFIKETDLVFFHYGFGLSWWNFIERKKRINTIKNSATLVLRGHEDIKNALEMCKQNNFLISEKGWEGYVKLTKEGGDLISIAGFFETWLKKYSALRTVLLTIFSTLLTSALVYKVASIIYHRFFS